MSIRSIAVAAALLLGTLCHAVPAAAQTGQAKAAARPAADAKESSGDGAARARYAGRSLVGKPGPNAVLTTLDGEKIDLVKLYGKKPVYLKFWATWCVPCREQMPAFEQVFQQYGERMTVVAVNTGFSDDDKAVRAFRKQYGIHMPVAIDDGSLAAQLNLKVTPQHVLIGRDGRIAHVGHLHDKALTEALDRALVDKGEPVAFTAGDAAPNERVFKVGDTVQGLTVTPLGGKPVTLGAASASAGKPRALVFFASWCESYLRESRPDTAQACRRVREQQNKLAASKDVEWLGIAGGLWSSEPELADYRKTSKTSLPLALDKDGAVFRAFGIRQIPSVVLLDAQGKVTRVLGPDERDLAGAIRGLKAD